jgi:hypothetical protein
MPEFGDEEVARDRGGQTSHGIKAGPAIGPALSGCVYL